MIIFLTGVPGTGKTSFSKEFSKLGFKVIRINDLVIKGRKKLKKGKIEEIVVNLKRLNKKLKKEIEENLKTNKNILVEGHLACELNIKPDICIVLRKNPIELIKILKKRKYKNWKIKENVECELIDYCGIKSKKNLNCIVYEIEYPKEKKKVMKRIERIVKGERRGEEMKEIKFEDRYIDWISKMNKKSLEKLMYWLNK